MASVSPDSVRKARAFLFGRGAIASDIPPRKFAAAAEELNLSFQQLLALIARLYDAGQNQQQFRLEAIAREAASGK